MLLHPEKTTGLRLRIGDGLTRSMGFPAAKCHTATSQRGTPQNSVNWYRNPIIVLNFHFFGARKKKKNIAPRIVWRKVQWFSLPPFWVSLTAMGWSTCGERDRCENLQVSAGCEWDIQVTSDIPGTWNVHVYTTLKGSMVSHSHVLVYHSRSPLQMATFWELALRHLPSLRCKWLLVLTFGWWFQIFFWM